MRQYVNKVVISAKSREAASTSLICEQLDTEIRKAVEDCKEDLAYCLYTGEPLEPKPEMSRLRRWLGWKLWGLAGRINPDVMY